MKKEAQKFVAIGRARKPHGITGELKVFIEDRFLEDFLKNERVFIAVKNLNLPYFIANIRGKSELIIQFEEVNDRDAAQALAAKEILLREQDLIPDDERELEIEEDSALEYADLAGYMIVDQTLGEVGAIKEVLEMPQQEMAFLDYKGREVLIPLNKQLIQSVDAAAKMVRMNLPEGLLEV